MVNKKRVGAGFGVVLLKDGKVLLGKRHDDPVKASSMLHGEGTWTLPGGKLDFGETFEEGTAREVLEETGIRINNTTLRFISITNDRVPDAHFVTLGFLCEKFSGEPKVMEPDEITTWEWFPLDQLPTPLFPPVVKIFKNFSEGRVYNTEC
ncbi:MAG: NUDIX domain-containing protein [bacterium]|nr:NUDIX domain-containing protein [bacterium]